MRAVQAVTDLLQGFVRQTGLPDASLPAWQQDVGTMPHGSGCQPDWHDTMLQGPESVSHQPAEQAALREQREEPHRQPGREAVRP